MKKILLGVSRYLKEGTAIKTLLPEGTSYLKGIGILMIIFHNYFHWVAPNTGENEFDFALSRVHSIGRLLGASPLEFINILFSFFGHYGVQLFIVLSGYGLVRQMQKRGESWAQFSLSSRMVKLYSLLFISFVVALFFTFYADKALPGSEWFKSFGYYFLMINSIVPGQLFAIHGPWWFFGLIFQFYLVFPLLYYILDKYHTKGLLILGIVSYLLFYGLLPLFEGININLMATVFGHLPEFLLGMWLASRPTIKIPGWMLIVAIGLVYSGNYVEFLWPFSFIGFSLFLVMLLWAKGLKVQENQGLGRFFVFLGSVSMYLFAIHGFIRYPFVSLANSFTNPFYTILIGLFYFATILILSVGVKILMDYFRSKTSDFLIQLKGMRFYEKFHSKIIIGSFQWLRFFWVLVVFHFVMRLVEFLFGKYLGALVAVDFMDFYAVVLSYDTIALVVFSLFWYLAFVISTFFSKSLGTIINYMVVLLYALGSTLLMGYFFYSRVPLDHSLFSYTIAESFAIAGSSGFPSGHDFILFGVVICLLILLFKWIRVGKNFLAGWVVIVTGLLLFVSSVSLIQKPADAKDESTYFGSVNKLHLFVSSCFTRLTVNNEYNASNESVVKAFKRYKQGSEKLFMASKYPFWHIDKYQDVLGPFFNKPTAKPNIVFIVVESLGSDVCGPNARFKGVSPYLDSLINHSLYWPNTLATSQRTFGVLPGLLGSLPFGKEGFLKLRETMPRHESIMTRLKENGYRLTFNYGGYPEFQDMDAFIKRNRFDRLLPNPFLNPKETPKEEFNQWGFHDSVLFTKAISAMTEQYWNSPRMDFYLTLSTHDPFDFYGNEAYRNKIESLLPKFTGEEKNILAMGKGYFSAVSYTDQCIKKLIEMYSKKPGFENTIFVITGDHSSDYSAAKSFLNKYHVPLIIYSPLLKRGQEFKAVNSHWDIVPSLLAYLRDNGGIISSDESAFLGDGLDVNKEFRNIHEIPFMLNNRSVDEYLSKDLFVMDNSLFTLNADLTLTPKENKEELAYLIDGRESFKLLSQYVCNENKLMKEESKEGGSKIIYSADYNYDITDSKLPYFDKLSDEKSVSGKQSYHLQKNVEFGFITDDVSIPSTTASIEISLSSKMYVVDFGKDLAKVIVEIADENGNSLVYDKSMFKALNNSPIGNAVWNNLIYFKVFELPPDLKGEKLKVKLYFWNKDGSEFYMDDLKVKYSVR